MDKKTIPELSIDAQELFKALVKVPMGGVIEYATLSKIISADVQLRGKGFLATARKLAQREHRMVFEPVRNVGLKRLSDSAIGVAAEATIPKIHRAARRGAQKLACAEYGALSKEEQVKHNTTASALGMLHNITSNASVRRLETVVKKAEEKLPLGKTLAAFQAE